MKVTKYIETEVEVQIEVTAEDIIAAIDESPNTNFTVMRAINSFARFFNALEPRYIEEMTAAQRKVVREFLEKQIARFPNPPAKKD